jgi:hypothetical protein
MSAQLVTFRLTRLRCIKESDTKGGSEPYLWVTYFAVDGRNALQATPVTTDTMPATFTRKEFPNNVTDGQVINIPSSLSPRSFQIDRGPVNFMMAGCVTVLLEEDETPEDAIIAGHTAYAKEINKQLNALVKKRIAALDTSDIKNAEVKVIREAVQSKVKSAISDNLSIGEKLFDNQDDLLGFTFVNFVNDAIQTRTFDFPEIFEGDKQATSSNRYVLSGTVTAGPVPPDPVELCPKQRAALKAKLQEIKGLESEVVSLQQRLATATPQQKPGIIDAIHTTNAEIAKAEAELPTLEAALKACLSDPHVGTHVDVSDPVTVKN